MRALSAAALVVAVSVGAAFDAGAARHKLAYLPTARHSSETGYGVGIKFKAYSQETSSGVTTRILAGGTYTEKGQYTARLDTGAWDEATGVELRLVFEIRTIPERYYGIGSDSQSEDVEVFDPRRERFHTTLYKYLTPNLKLGIRYEFENVEVEGVDAGGALATSGLVGLTGTSASGLGLLLGWDSRNDRDDPTTGSYHQLYAVRFDDQFFSSHDFDTLIADLRWYTPLGAATTLASQAFVYNVERDVPFTRLAALGGRAHSRGYRRGRFLDDTLVAVQSELRWDHAMGIEWVAFLGAAQVVHGANDFRLSELKPTVGVGVRAQPKYAPARGRFDAALGIDDVRFYIGFGEAF